MIFYVQRGYDSNLFIHKCNLFQELSTQYVQFCGLCGAIFRAIVIDLIGVIHNEFSSTAKRQSRAFLKKWLHLVAAKLSLEVVPFCKTQGNSRDLSLTMFLTVFAFFPALRLGSGIYSCLGGICSFCCVQLGGNWVYCSCFLISDFCMFNCI